MRSRSTWGIGLVVVALAGFVTIADATPAIACSCAAESVATIEFEGRATRRVRQRPNGGGSSAWRFVVDTPIRGVEPRQELTVRLALAERGEPQGAACEIGRQLVKGGTYRVVASDRTVDGVRHHHVSLCAGSLAVLHEPSRAMRPRPVLVMAVVTALAVGVFVVVSTTLRRRGRAHGA